MQFDFSGLRTDSEESFASDFNREIEWTVYFFLSKYADILPNVEDLKAKIEDKKTGSSTLELAYLAATVTNNKIFIIIDEYDHFANDLIAMGSHAGEDVYRRMVRDFMDIYLQRSPLLPDIPYEWVWEIKYLKKSDEASLAEKKKAARVQLEKYRQSQLFSSRTDVRYLSLIFIGKDAYEIEEI